VPALPSWSLPATHFASQAAASPTQSATPAPSSSGAPLPRIAALDVPGALPAPQSVDETMRWPQAQVRVAHAPLEMPTGAPLPAPPPEMDEGRLPADSGGLLDAVFPVPADDERPPRMSAFDAPAEVSNAPRLAPRSPFEGLPERPGDHSEASQALSAFGALDAIEEAFPVDVDEGPVAEEAEQPAPLVEADFGDVQDVLGAPVLGAPVPPAAQPAPLAAAEPAALPAGLPLHADTAPVGSPDEAAEVIITAPMPAVVQERLAQRAVPTAEGGAFASFSLPAALAAPPGPPAPSVTAPSRDLSGSGEPVGDEGAAMGSLPPAIAGPGVVGATAIASPSAPTTTSPFGQPLVRPGAGSPFGQPLVEPPAQEPLAGAPLVQPTVGGALAFANPFGAQPTALGPAPTPILPPAQQAPAQPPPAQQPPPKNATLPYFSLPASALPPLASPELSAPTGLASIPPSTATPAPTASPWVPIGSPTPPPTALAAEPFAAPFQAPAPIAVPRMPTGLEPVPGASASPPPIEDGGAPLRTDPFFPVRAGVPGAPNDNPFGPRPVAVPPSAPPDPASGRPRTAMMWAVNPPEAPPAPQPNSRVTTAPMLAAPGPSAAQAASTLLSTPVAALADLPADALTPLDDAFDISFEAAPAPARVEHHEPAQWHVEQPPPHAEEDDLPLVVGNTELLDEPWVVPPKK
jgi:hypothetical protein